MPSPAEKAHRRERKAARRRKRTLRRSAREREQLEAAIEAQRWLRKAEGR